MSTQGYVLLTAEFHRENRKWVGVCKELGTSTFGRTLQEADARLRDAVCLHLNALEDVGEVKQVFEENGILFQVARPKKSTTISIPVREHVFTSPMIQRIPDLKDCRANV